MFGRLFGKKEKMSVPQFNLPADADLTSTPSGLRYLIHEAGVGAPPGPTDKVTVHYAGWTLDGKLFDSSYSRGKTISFPLNGVIKGWTEGLQLMKEGGKATLVIPSELAYGKRGAPPAIGPDAELVFLVELVSVS